MACMTMACGLNVSTLTCTITQPTLSSCKSLCQRMSWQLFLSESHDVQAAFYTVNLCLKCQKLHWHTSQQARKCSHGVSTPHLLGIDQSDVTICAWVKVNDYYTVDCSSWNCVHLTTVSSKHKPLNQNKHLDSIIPCWKSLIVNLQSTLSKAVQSAEHRHTGHLRNTLPFELSVWFK